MDNPTITATPPKGGNNRKTKMKTISQRRADATLIANKLEMVFAEARQLGVEILSADEMTVAELQAENATVNDDEVTITIWSERK